MNNGTKEEKVMERKNYHNELLEIKKNIVRDIISLMKKHELTILEFPYDWELTEDNVNIQTDCEIGYNEITSRMVALHEIELVNGKYLSFNAFDDDRDERDYEVDDIDIFSLSYIYDEVCNLLGLK